MARTSFADFACSVARTMDVVGEWWTPLILRDIFLGLTRFDAIAADLGIPRKVLAERLAKLVEHGVLTRVAYRETGRTRHEYRLTEKGADFLTTLVALMDWGDRWQPLAEGPPTRAEHQGCGGRVAARLVCTECGAMPAVQEVVATAGPGVAAHKGTAVLGRLARRG